MAKDKEKVKKVEMGLEEFNQKEKAPVWEIFDFSANVPISLYSDSTGIKLPESCYRGALLSQNRLFCEEYLLNAKRSSIDMALPIGVSSYTNFFARGPLSFRNYIEEEEHEKPENVVSLPEYKKINAPLGAVIRSRRSIREMSGFPISLKDLSTILYYANGVSGDFNHSPAGSELPSTVSLGDQYVSKIRNAPSGGGLYPIYLYIIAQNVENLDKGIYRYMPLTHSLKKVKVFNEKDIEELHRLADWGRNIEREKINIMIFFVYYLYENARKYIDIGLNFALIETGEIAQNIHLVCTALSLAPCDIGGYDKVPCERFLKLDSLSRHIIHLTIIGS